MTLYSIIYLLYLLIAIKKTVVILTTASTVIMISSALILLMSYDSFRENELKTAKDILKKSTICTIIAAIFTIIIPTKEVIYQMGAVYFGKKINAMAHIDTKIKKVSEIIDMQLDKNIKQLQRAK